MGEITGEIKAAPATEVESVQQIDFIVIDPAYLKPKLILTPRQQTSSTTSDSLLHVDIQVSIMPPQRQLELSTGDN